MLTTPEFYFWFLFPTIVAITILVLSVILTKRSNNFVNQVSTTIIILLIIISEYVLYLIFFTGAWPTFTPHIFIVLTVMIYLLQVWRFRKIKRIDETAG